MNTAYIELQKIWQACLLSGDGELRRIIEILANHGISLRRKDGALIQINLSIPTSREDCYVVGLRYMKSDKRHTEDQFLCERDAEGLKKAEITYYSKRKLGYVLPEYEGTHKQQVDFSKIKMPELATDVSTLSYYGTFNGKDGKSS
jgi:hypothetical protein